MTIHLTIGGAALFGGAVPLHLDEAPRFQGNSPLNIGSNSRDIEYGEFTDFCRATGLYPLFYDPEHGLVRKNGHPGRVKLTAEHEDAIAAALHLYQTEHPAAVPGWGISLDRDLAHLIWLDWWVRETRARYLWPMIANS